MSHITFRSPSGTAKVRGTEQHYMRNTVNDLALGLLRIRRDEDVDKLMQLLPPGHHMEFIKRDRLPVWAEFFGTNWRVGEEDFIWHGHAFSALETSLNTALVLGGDPLRLMARLAGQSELHAWVDGPNRAWLAGILDEGLDSGLFRASTGWDDVTALLLTRDDEAVVTSYSIAGGFPDRDEAKWNRPAMPDDWRHPGWDEVEWRQMDEDAHAEYFDEEVVEGAWARLSDSDRWAAGVAGLREAPGRLELRPDDWTGFWFGRGVTVFDLNAADWERRLGEAFEVEPETVEV